VFTNIEQLMSKRFIILQNHVGYLMRLILYFSNNIIFAYITLRNVYLSVKIVTSIKVGTIIVLQDR